MRVAAVTYVTYFGLAGCAQLFGLDPTTSGGGGDAMAPTTSLSFQRISIGTTAVRAPQDLGGLAATFLIPDTTDPSGIRRVTAMQTATDTWSAPLDVAAPIEFLLPDVPTPLERIFDFPQQTVRGLYGVLEHPNPTAAPGGATLTVQATLNGAYAGEGLQMFSVGTWTQRGFSGAELPGIGATAWGPVAFPFSSVTSLNGRPLQQITKDDAVYLLRYTGPDLTGVLAIPPFDQTGTDTLSGALAPNAHDQTLDVQVDPTSPATRFAAARPAVTGLAMSWSVVAAPGYQIVSNAGPALISGGVAATDTGKLNLAYGNPFVASHDWPSLFTWSTSESRTFTPPGQALPVTLSAGLFQLAFPSPGLTLSLPAGLPITVTMNGHALASDGMMMTVDPTKAVEVSFVSDVADNTLFQLQLFELLPNAANTALVQTIRLGASGTKPSFLLPPELFQVGHIYELRAICIQGGYPTIGVGDLTQRAPPQAVGFLDAGQFTVVAP